MYSKKEVAEKQRRYYETRRKKKEWLHRTPEQIDKHKEANNKWHHSHREEIIGQQSKNREKLKFEVFSRYSHNGSPSCNQCNLTDIDILCLDHIQNGGVSERIRLGHVGGSVFYAKLKRQNYPRSYQVLCANCNLKKAIEYRRNGSS